MTNPIEARDDAIDIYLAEWTTNRAMIEGERAVKKMGAEFIPKSPSMSDAEYRAMVARTAFFPGASRTHEGLMALISRRPAKIDPPQSAKDIVNTITAKGYTVDHLADRILSELLITNFVGLVVDYPPSSGPLTKAQAIERGVRPFIAMYTAENILGIETGVINNRQRVTRVRLQENSSSIRELRLDDGCYTVTMWTKVGDQWSAGQAVIPTKGGKPIDEIPFTVATRDEDFEPSKAPLTDICAQNKQLFIAQSNLAQCHWWTCSPVPYLIKKMAEDEPIRSIAPGVMWEFDNEPSEVATGFISFDPGGVAELRAEVESLKTDMAKTGLRTIAPEKAFPESSEAEIVRGATENSIVATYALIRDRALNDSLAWVSWWLDLPEDSIVYESSTDYSVLTPDPQALTFLKSLYDGAIISRDTFIDLMIERDILPVSYDREKDATLIAQEVADRPPVIDVPEMQSARSEPVDEEQ